MTVLNAGQAKIDPPTGIAGAIYTGWVTDPDVSPAFPAGTLTSGSVKRKNLATFLDSVAAAMASFLSYGSGTIAMGANSVTIADTAVNASTVVVPSVNQATPDTACFAFSWTVNPGVSVTIKGNANAAAAVAVTYVAINPV
jgi:hypothetical protein